MRFTISAAIVLLMAAISTNAQCPGHSLANQGCGTARDCGDDALGLCGDTGFVCEATGSGQLCKKKSGVYCAPGSGECASGLTCVDGAPSVGSNHGPNHCA